MNDDLGQLADDFWQAMASYLPTHYRHMLGDYSEVDRYEDMSREADARLAEHMRSFADRAASIDDGTLDAQERVTRDVVASTAVAEGGLAASALNDLPADPVSGIQVELPIVLGLLSVPDADVADRMPDKLDSVGTHLGLLADRVREAATDGWVPAEFLVRKTIAQIEAVLATPLPDDPIVAAVRSPEETDEEAFRTTLRAALVRSVRPGFEAYRDALVAVLPQARPEERCGLSWLVGGDATYAAALRFNTTTDLNAQEIHEIGLEQVARLADEYRALGPEVVGTDNLQQIFEALRSDPKLHYEHADDIADQARVALARAEATMRHWFEVLPQAPCAVESTDVGAIAYYFPPANDGSRGGRSSSTRPTRRRGAGSKSNPWRSTKGCPATTYSWRSPPSSRTPFRHSKSMGTTPPMAKGGVCTANGSPMRWGSTPPPSTRWACTASTPCAPAGWSSTRGFTRWDGVGSRPSTTCSPTRR